MSALAKAIRDEMFSVLNEGDLTPARCSTLMRLADHGREILRAVTPKPEDFQDGTEHNGTVENPGLNVETYGVKMFKELMPVFNRVVGGKNQMKDLIVALAEARRLGLDDVVKKLEDELGLEPPPAVTQQVPTGSASLSVGLPRHSGGMVDTTNHCDDPDCWCYSAVNPMHSTAGAVIRAVGVDVEAP